MFVLNLVLECLHDRTPVQYVYLITGEMKDMFGDLKITAGLQERLWMKLPLAGKVFDFFMYSTCMPVAVCMRCVHTHVMTDTGNSKLLRWTHGEQLWTQHWCGVPVCCKHLSVGVGPGSSCWTYREQMCKITTGQKTLHLSRTSSYTLCTGIPPVAVCTCMY